MPMLPAPSFRLEFVLLHMHFSILYAFLLTNLILYFSSSYPPQFALGL